MIKDLQKIEIGQTDIFLEDLEPGHGKITISDSYHGAFTYYWGAMGSDIKSFIKRIDSNYFANKLSTNSLVFSAKESAKSVRKYIRTDMSYDLPWYKFRSAQKEMRELIKQLEYCESEQGFVDSMIRIPDRIYCMDLTRKEEDEFRSIIGGLFTCEPWHFIEKSVSEEYKWLQKIHKELNKINSL